MKETEEEREGGRLRPGRNPVGVSGDAEGGRDWLSSRAHAACSHGALWPPPPAFAGRASGPALRSHRTLSSVPAWAPEPVSGLPHWAQSL